MNRVHGKWFQYTVFTVFLIFVSSGVGCSGSGSIQDSEAAVKPAEENMQALSKGPKIEFERTAHDFGKIYSGEKVKTQFKFRNAGNETLIIDKLKSSCGCTAAIADQKEIAPGDTGLIDVEFNAKDRRGSQAKTLRVFSNDPKSNPVELRITAEVQIYLSFDRERVYFSNLRKNRLTSQMVALKGIKASGAKIKKIQFEDPSHADYYDLKIGSIKTEEGSFATLTITPTDKIPTDRFRETLTVFTDVDGTEPLKIYLSGEMLGPLKADPRTMTLKHNSKSDEYRGKVSIIPEKGKKFEILSVVCSDERLRIMVGKPDSSGRMEIEASLPVDFNEKRFASTLKVKTTLRDQPEMTIPVYCRIYSNQEMSPEGK